MRDTEPKKAYYKTERPMRVYPRRIKKEREREKERTRALDKKSHHGHCACRTMLSFTDCIVRGVSYTLYAVNVRRIVERASAKEIETTWSRARETDEIKEKRKSRITESGRERERDGRGRKGKYVQSQLRTLLVRSILLPAFFRSHFFFHRSFRSSRSNESTVY